MQILKHGELVDVPWKNGGGITRSIARGLGATGTAWTISRADVTQDGSFSDFTGMMRVLTVVSDGAMTLEGPDDVVLAKPWKPVQFDGGMQCVARLEDGPLTDLNLMFDPATCAGKVTPHRSPMQRRIAGPAHGLLAFHILSGAPGVNAVSLATGDTAFCENTDAEVVLGDGDALLEIRLSYAAQSTAIRLCIAAR